jgi:hypothetical protein
MFFILKMVDNKLTFYESPTHNLSKDVTHVKSSDSQLREIVLLAREWVHFFYQCPYLLLMDNCRLFFQVEAHQG